jgi:hypothetical protein
VRERGGEAGGRGGFDADDAGADLRAVAGGCGREGADADGDEDHVVACLCGRLREESLVAVDHPLGRPAVSDVRDEGGAGLRGGEARGLHGVLVGPVDDDHLGALGRDRFASGGERACREIDPAGEPAQGRGACDGAAVVPGAGRDQRPRLRQVAQGALDRPRGAEDLERGQAEAIRLVLEPDRAQAELRRDVVQPVERRGRVARQSAVEGDGLVARGRDRAVIQRRVHERSHALLRIGMPAPILRSGPKHGGRNLCAWQHSTRPRSRGCSPTAPGRR